MKTGLLAALAERDGAAVGEDVRAADRDDGSYSAAGVARQPGVGLRVDPPRADLLAHRRWRYRQFVGRAGERQMACRGIQHAQLIGVNDDMTAAQMVALVILLANPPQPTIWVGMGYALLIVAAGLTLWSMINYLMAAWPHLSTTEKK